MIKHIFIVNPAAGKGIESSSALERIRDACKVSRVEYELHMTEGVGDATRFVRRKIAEKPAGDDYRFYACGGDGTLSEVIAGAIDEALGEPIPNVHIGCIPLGTGNDFIRNFAQSEFFADVTKQLLADPTVVDCFALEPDSRESRYGINMVNIGFDCDVVAKTAEIKKKPFIPKKLAYVMGVAVTLKENLGKTVTVVREDGSESTAEYQLVSVANGGFCGGGFHSAPKSRLDDGLLDVSLIKKVTRLQLLRLIGSYKQGKHLDTRLGRKMVTYAQEKRVTFRFSEEINVCVDGEILPMREVSFRIVPRAVSFLMPVGTQGLALLEAK